MIGGMTNINGGTAHKGKVMTIASTAAIVEMRVQPKLVQTLPPCLSAKCAKRRCTTKFTKAGVIINETASKESSTNKGVMANQPAATQSAPEKDKDKAPAAPAAASDVPAAPAAKSDVPAAPADAAKAGQAPSK